MQCDFSLLAASERLIGDQGEQEFGEGWHAAILGAPVMAASFRGDTLHLTTAALSRNESMSTT